MEIKVFKINENAKIPMRAHEDDAGYDLYAVGTFTLGPRCTTWTRTGLKLAIPKGWEIQIRPKSGLAGRGITVLNTPGTVDASFRGEVLVLLYNATNDECAFKSGDKIAQMVLKPVYDIEFIEVEAEGLLGETVRGENGFGSTG